MSNVEALITGHIDASRDDKERIEKIDDLLHLLNFERRLASLTTEEKVAMMRAGETTLSSALLDRLNKCETDAERDRVIEETAMAQYFRQCAWADYLNGTGTMPFVATNKGKEDKSRLYVWDDVLTDFTKGIMFAVAPSIEEARAVLSKKYPNLPDDDLDQQPKELGFSEPFAFALWGGS